MTSVQEARRVLIVDDSWVVLENLRRALAGAGYSVKLAATDVTATREVPWAELVIVDFHMPLMDGRAMLPHLRRAVQEGSHCSFYLYTSDNDVARRYGEYGFDGGLIRKGDEAALLPQVDAAFRTIKLKQLASSLRSTRKLPPNTR